MNFARNNAKYAVFDLKIEIARHFYVGNSLGGVFEAPEGAEGTTSDCVSRHGKGTTQP